MVDRMTLLPGTLDLLILRAVSLGKLHGYGVLLRIQQISNDNLLIEQGTLYPALYRLEQQGLIAGEWGTSDNNRRAKYYTLTRKGQTRLRQETEDWTRMVRVMGAVLRARPAEG
jgi:PadR family transcriptional regulator, regulatory protein PadR